MEMSFCLSQLFYIILLNTKQFCSRHHSKIDFIIFQLKLTFHVIHVKCQPLISLKNK